jgi:hypothetical protein
MTITRDLQAQARDVLDALGPEVTADARAALQLQYDLYDAWAGKRPKATALKVYEVHHAHEAIREAGLRGLVSGEGDAAAHMRAMNEAMEAARKGLTSTHA